jgi:hypothetical protein
VCEVTVLTVFDPKHAENVRALGSHSDEYEGGCLLGCIDITVVEVYQRSSP